MVTQSTNLKTLVLKEYYSKYLINVRCLKQSTVNHYYDALNNISRRLKDKKLIEENIYEVMDLDYLISLRDILYSDPLFIEADTRGNRMYSAGLNNYIRFAEGVGLISDADQVRKLDTPFEPEKPIVIEQTIWKRSNILRTQAIQFANNKCELDGTHVSFIAEKDHKPYMEGHHALPMKLQDKFNHSLDVYANIVCLCPLCHKRIHYGLKSERKELIGRIYDERFSRLIDSGIKIDKRDYIELAIM